MTKQVTDKSLISSTEVIQLTLTLKMPTTAQVVETSVTANNNSPIHDYVYPDDLTQFTYEMTPGFKPSQKWNKNKTTSPFLKAWEANLSWLIRFLDWLLSFPMN